jgi:hypothetical protein
VQANESQLQNDFPDYVNQQHECKCGKARQARELVAEDFAERPTDDPFSGFIGIDVVG